MNCTLGVGAVIGRGGSVLLVRLNYGKSRGKLTLPGGFVEKGEAPEEAVRREVLEETSIECSPERVVAVRSGVREARGEDETTLYIAFEATAEEGEPHPDGREVTDAMFVPMTEALQSDEVTDLSKEILRAVSHGGGLAPLRRHLSTSNPWKTSEVYRFEGDP